MTTHELKTIVPYFEEVRTGRKNFEFRKNDRHFQRGDGLWLREWHVRKGSPDVYTGREILCTISYVLTDFEGIKPGYAVLALTEVNPNGTTNDPIQ